jgi:hypothetical protein
VKPTFSSFPLVYREAVEVNWDASKKVLYSPKPREWSYFDWFRHIIDIAYGDKSKVSITPETAWIQIPEDLRLQIKSWITSE